MQASSELLKQCHFLFMKWMMKTDDCSLMTVAQGIRFGMSHMFFASLAIWFRKEPYCPYTS